MNKIKFSHNYLKLGCRDCGEEIINFAILLFVIDCNYRDLDKEFIVYDTYFVEGNKYDLYELPKTDLIILLFRDAYSHRLFTTIRRYTPKKYDYYKSKMGEIFNIIIEKEKK